jgi:hypothetical protein
VGPGLNRSNLSTNSTTSQMVSEPEVISRIESGERSGHDRSIVLSPPNRDHTVMSAGHPTTASVLKTPGILGNAHSVLCYTIHYYILVSKEEN